MVRAVRAERVKELFAALMAAPLLSFPNKGEKLVCERTRGVYVIYGPDGSVLHVGDTPRAKGGIEQRIKNHLAGKSSFVRKMYGGDGSRLRSGNSFRCIGVADGRLRALLQAYAIGHLCPEHIGAGL